MRYYIIDEDGELWWTDDETVAKELSATDTISVYYYDDLLSKLVRYGNVDDQYRLPRKWGTSE